jgi:hypothetical protein
MKVIGGGIIRDDLLQMSCGLGCSDIARKIGMMVEPEKIADRTEAVVAAERACASLR